MNKVFIPKVPTRFDPISNSRISSIDLRPAMKFGELVVLLDTKQAITTANSEDSLTEIQRNISGITLADYVLAIGDPILIAAAIAYANDKLGQANVLRWDRRSKAYQTIEVKL